MRRLRIISFSILLFVLLTACGGKPFNVKPKPDLPARELGAEAVAGNLTLQAEAVTDEDFLYETFDANLILAGVLPVRVTVSSREQEPVDLRKAKFEVKTSGGRTYKTISANSAFKRAISYYGISTYSKEGYKESQSDFASHAIDLREPLAAGASRHGMIFFQVPDDVARTAGLTLVSRNLNRKLPKSESQIEIKLN
ncbi:MAG TPA: hypothetical protein VF131_25900 [Blastocatellia bacterium]|nr:hypothetical protein [Blastocatellia bacterium]